jgi:glyoxylase-like metal-dependent hydrolase (beta-lactamase superfamily II)
MIILRFKVTNCFLIPVDDKFMLVDTGYEWEYEKLIERLLQNQITLQNIKYLFITHNHDDHVGLVQKVLEENPCIKIITSKIGKDFLASGKHNNSKGAGYINKRVGFVLQLKGKFDKKWTHSFPPVILRDNDIIIDKDVSFKEINININGKIICTPGHAKDCISILFENGECISGDATANFLGFLGTKNCVISVNDLDEYYNSWDKLIAENVKTIFPSHGKAFKAERLLKNIRKNKKKNMKVWETEKKG